MEKSIESIWKRGFLHGDALVAPKVNDLYNQKSIHLIDKFKRMFKINLNAVVTGSLLFLAVSFLIGIPLMGIGFFITLSAIVVVNRKLSRGLDKIDKNESSYHYIKSFDNWMNQQVRVNRIMAKIYYPLFFLSAVLGFWFYTLNGERIGETITDKLTSYDPDVYLLFGVPVVVPIGVLVVMVLLSFVGGKIYNWDLKIVYGGVLRKLNELIGDMEELRKESSNRN